VLVQRRTWQGRRERAWWLHQQPTTSLLLGQPIRGSFSGPAHVARSSHIAAMRSMACSGKSVKQGDMLARQVQPSTL